MTENFKTTFTPGPTFTNKLNDVVVIGRASAYAYRARPTLTAINVTTDQAIAMTSDGHISTVLDQWTAPAGIQVDNDFVTEWQGSLVGEVDTAANLEIILHTKHEFNGKTITNSRHYFFDAAAGVRWTVPLNVFDSRAQVKLGTFSGTSINANDIATAAVITYSFEIVSHGRKTEVARNTNTLKYLKSLNIGTISYQLQRAVTTGGGTGSGDGDDNVQSDWDQTDTSADDFIKNKPDIPDEVDVSTIRQLPTFPDAGDRDDKIPKWDGDVLGWETDASGTGGASDFSDLNGKITEGQIPDDILVNRMYKDDQITKDKFVTGVRDSLDKADAAQALSDAVQSVDALPTTIPDVNTAFLLRDPVDGNDEGLYIVKEDAEDYYEGFVSPSSDSVIGLEVNLDHNPNGSMREIEWTINGVHIYAEFTPASFSGTPPANLYIEALNVDPDGDTIDSTNVLSDADRMNSRAVLVRESVFDRDGNYSYGNQLTHDTLVFWGGVDNGARIRFKVYSDSGYSTPLIAAGGKYYDLITDNKFPRQMILERLSQGGASNGQILAWDDAKQSWLPATESSGAKTYVRGIAPTADAASAEADAANDDDTWIEVPTGTGSPIEIWTKDEGAWIKLGRADYSEDQVSDLKHLTRDLHIHAEEPTWVDADDTEGVLHFELHTDGVPVNITNADFDGGASGTIPGNTQGDARDTFIYVRMPSGEKRQNYRLLINDKVEDLGNYWVNPDNHGDTRASSLEAAFQYWFALQVHAGTPIKVALQKHDDLASTEFSGTLSNEALNRRFDDTDDQIHELNHLTRNLHVTAEHADYSNAPDADGDLYQRLETDGSALTDADFDLNGASIQIPDGQNDFTNVYVRLPTAADHRDYRITFDGRLPRTGNTWHPVTGPDETTYNYYRVIRVNNYGFSIIQLQKHDGTLIDTVFDGDLGEGIVTEASLDTALKAKVNATSSGGDGGSATPNELYLDSAAVTAAADRWRAVTLASTPDENSIITIRHFQYDGQAIDEGAIGAVTFPAKEWLDLPVWTKTGTQTNTVLASGNVLGFQAIWVPDKAIASLSNAHMVVARYSDTSMGVLFTSTSNQALRITEYPSGGGGSSEGGGEQGPQGGFEFILYSKSSTAPTAGTYDYDSDTFTVTPNTWSGATPEIDESKGERLYAIRAKIDPRNDAGKTINLPDRWGEVYAVDGKDGQGHNFDDFPTIANYDEGDLVTVQNKIYQVTTTDDSVPNLYEGVVGPQYVTGGVTKRGTLSSLSQSGRTSGSFTSNPNNGMAWIEADDERHIQVAIVKSELDDAKGSSFLTTEHIAIKWTGASGNIDEAVLGYFSSYDKDINGTDQPIYIMSHRHATDNYHLLTEPTRNAWKAEFFTVVNGVASTTPFLTHETSEPHYVRFDTETDSNAARALQLAIANQSRLDAFDASVGLAEPIHTKTYDENTALTAPTLGNSGDNAVATTFSNIEPDDLLFFEYKNFDHLNHHSEHVIPGSTRASGQMFVRAGNFNASEFDGEFGNAIDRARQNDGAADELNSWVVTSIIYSGTTLTFALHLQQGGNRTNRNLLPPVGFEMKMSIYRSTAASASLGLLHTEVETVKGQVGSINFVRLTQTEFDALTPTEGTIYYVRPDA